MLSLAPRLLITCIPYCPECPLLCNMFIKTGFRLTKWF